MRYEVDVSGSPTPRVVEASSPEMAVRIATPGKVEISANKSGGWSGWVRNGLRGGYVTVRLVDTDQE